MLTPARIEWRGTQPYAPDFDDIYFSPDAANEVRRVFVEPTALSRMCQQQNLLTIGELGFGTGLNFAVCAETVLQHPATRLHFISVEAHPLSHHDGQKVSRTWRRSLPIYTEIGAQPLPLLGGWQRRQFANGRITLSVFHGDVDDALAQLCLEQQQPIDAWWLDGFAPSRNPAMWSPRVMHALAQLAHPGTRCATFTAAGAVRRALIDVGFNMQRIDQRPLKRESLAGDYVGARQGNVFTPPRQVDVHGAGIAGANIARILAEQGVSVRVFDTQPCTALPTKYQTGPAELGASHLSAAVMHGRLLGDRSLEADLRAAAFHHTSNYLERFDGFARSGVLQLSGPNMNPQKMRRITDAYAAHSTAQHHWIHPLNATEASRLAGIEVSPSAEIDALWFPTAGSVDIAILTQHLLSHPDIEHIRASDGQPQLEAQRPTILCLGLATRQVADLEWLEISPVAGQIDHVATGSVRPKIPIVAQGYLLPTPQGYAAGATYEYEAWTGEAATTHNVAFAETLLNQPASLEHETQSAIRWRGRERGTRAVSSDRIPIVGRGVRGREVLNEQGRSDRRPHTGGSHEYIPNLWLATAFGSLGTMLAPFAAACLASDILGWVAPADRNTRALMRPERFLERQARRGVRGVVDPP